jgi:hypothetical protein
MSRRRKNHTGESTPQPVFHYRGEPVFLNHVQQFTTPMLSESGGFETSKEIRGAIDRLTVRKVRAEREKLTIGAVSVDRGRDNELILTTHDIKGIHAGHGSILMTPEHDRYNGKVYIDHMNVRKLLQKRYRLERQLEDMESVLSEFEIKRPGERGNLDDAELDRRIKWLKSDAKRKLKRAGKLKVT